jgi:hypothetical protein
VKAVDLQKTWEWITDVDWTLVAASSLSCWLSVDVEDVCNVAWATALCVLK